MAHPVAVGLDLAVPDAGSREPLQQVVEAGDAEGDAAGAGALGTRLDEERRVLLDVPEDLVAGAEVRLATEEPPVLVERGIEVGHRDSGDHVSD